MYDRQIAFQLKKLRARAKERQQTSKDTGMWKDINREQLRSPSLRPARALTKPSSIMLKLLCCYGRGVSDNFKDEFATSTVVVTTPITSVNPSQNEKAVVAVTTNISSDSGAPTEAQYLKAFGIGFLETLDEVSKFAPEPVPEIVHLGVALIKAFDSAGETLESAKSLRGRIEILISILVDEVPKNEKEKAEIPQRLLKDIIQFQMDLTSIITKLNAIEQQRQPLLLVFQSLNEEKIQECVDCLAASLNQFQLSGQIGNVRAVEDLKRRIASCLTSLEEMNDNIKEMQSTLLKIDQKLDATQSSQSLMQRPDIPPPPRVFYGRDSDVADAAAALTQTKRKHFGLLGQGGIGKTTTALAVLHDTRIREYFTTRHGNIVSDRRIWVSCAGVDTVEKFDHTLLTAVAGGQESPNARQTAINELKMLAGPILIVLDNFETLWNAPSARLEVETILLSLSALPQLSILVTMRAGEPPCDDLDWDHKSIDAVDDVAARSIYLERRHSEPSEISVQEDAALSELLKMVGNLPLAITLLAASARKQKATVIDMLSQYKSLGTSMLGPSGTDPYHNMNLCVQVSIDRMTGEFRDASLHLLARLSMLPAGATTASFWLKDLKNVISPALDLLIDGALVQIQKPGSGLTRYTIHPVIRDYILDENRCPSDVLVKLLKLAYDFLESSKYNIGDAGFKERAAIIRTEETNLQAVLLIPSTADVDDSLIDTLLLLAKHHAATNPCLEVAEKAVSLAKSANKSLLQAEAQFALGRNLHVLDRYSEAKKCFESARELFRGEPAVGQAVSRAADCLLEIVYELGYMTTGSFMKKMDIANQALAEYQSVSDEIGVGRYFRQRSRVFLQACRNVEALEAIEEACKRLSNSPYDLGLCYYNQSHLNFTVEMFEEGDRYGKLAIKLLNKFGSSADQARHLSWMGDGHNEWGHYHSAVELFNDAIDRYTECGLLLGLAQSWDGMSIALMAMGKVDLATKSNQKAYQFSSLLPEGELRTSSLRRCERRERMLAFV